MKGDTALMHQQLAWSPILAAQSDTEAYYGRVQKAREYTRRAVESAEKADLKESAAAWDVEAGMREAMFGYPDMARKDPDLKLAPNSRAVRALAALIYARTGDGAEAQRITDDLRALYVSNMVMQKAWLPVVKAQLALQKGQNADAVQALEVVEPYEKGQLTGNLSDSCMIPAYLRGEAQLNAHKGREAKVEFQKIPANPGGDWKLLVPPAGNPGTGARGSGRRLHSRCKKHL